MQRTLLLILLTLLPMTPLQAAVLSSDTADMPAAEAVSETEITSTDGAKIIELEGDVRILKEDSTDWQAAKKDQAIEVGDQIITGKASSADIVYDDYLLNITHIEENTKAEFRSINPTDIYLEDGSIFSALDGLEGEGEYQIATPTAVAGVRGTHFDVAFDENTQKFSAASLPSGEEGHKSIIFVKDPKNPQAVPLEIVENKQFDLRFGEPIHQDRIRVVEPQRLRMAQNTFQQMEKRMPQFQERRQEGKIHFEERKQMRLEGKDPNFKPNLNQNQNPNRDEKFRAENDSALPRNPMQPMPPLEGKPKKDGQLQNPMNPNGLRPQEQQKPFQPQHQPQPQRMQEGGPKPIQHPPMIPQQPGMQQPQQQPQPQRPNQQGNGGRPAGPARPGPQKK